MISKRAFTLGGLAAIPIPTMARAEDTRVPFQLRVYIPSPAVKY